MSTGVTLAPYPALVVGIGSDYTCLRMATRNFSFKSGFMASSVLTDKAGSLHCMHDKLCQTQINGIPIPLQDSAPQITLTDGSITECIILWPVLLVDRRFSFPSIFSHFLFFWFALIIFRIIHICFFSFLLLFLFRLLSSVLDLLLIFGLILLSILVSPLCPSPPPVPGFILFNTSYRPLS